MNPNDSFFRKNIEILSISIIVGYFANNFVNIFLQLNNVCYDKFFVIAKNPTFLNSIPFGPIKLFHGACLYARWSNSYNMPMDFLFIINSIGENFSNIYFWTLNYIFWFLIVGIILYLIKKCINLKNY